ncbi:MAG: hypothetical protein CL912_09420 [Deltaproteobacteria bacterium]|nr:hypothetical protein [Deltaproteobacteria bacterium]
MAEFFDDNWTFLKAFATSISPLHLKRTSLLSAIAGLLSYLVILNPSFAAGPAHPQTDWMPPKRMAGRRKPTTSTHSV